MLGAVVNAPHNIRVGSTKIKDTQGLLTCQQFLGSNWDHPTEVHRTVDTSTQISPLSFLPLRSSGKMAKVKVKLLLLRTKDLASNKLLPLFVDPYFLFRRHIKT